ncbi:SusC/RagA family TonB-linked outer membrane protein [Mucilaginibacter sp. 21P]|nr:MULTISPECIES: SusC/RagA family TonB-linked outer membrane protein [Mucilaginibacter]QXV66257.1 SusC/RagA family TonB-linked outer membrane protein [Mucilaginibacter sp. 21P]
MKKLLLVSLCFLSLFVTQVYAQNRTITGTVTSKDDGLPLPGVSVTVTGASIGTQTNAAGKFSLSIPASAKSLTFSFIGFKKQEKQLGSGSALNVVLESSANELGEVVVTGALGIQKAKRETAYSSTTVTSKDINQTNVTNFANGLTAKVAGLAIQTVDNSIDPNVTIKLRGNRSIAGNNNALIVIDGVPAPYGAINSINPDDIAETQILKGAGAAALYGSEASNGAVLITTKRGASNGKPVISYNNSFQIQQVGFFPKFQNTYGMYGGEGAPYIDPLTGGATYVPYENQLYGPAYDPTGNTKVQVGYPAGSATGPTLVVPYKALPKNPIESFFNTGIVEQNEVSVQQGDAANSFYLSAQNVYSKGVVPNDKNLRTSVSARGARTLGIFKADYSVSYTKTDVSTYGTGYNGSLLYTNLMQWPAFLDIKQFRNANTGTFSNPSDFYDAYAINPYWIVDNSRINTSRDVFLSNLKLSLNPTKWMDLAYHVSYNFGVNQQRFTQSEVRFTPYGVSDPYGASSVQSTFKNTLLAPGRVADVYQFGDGTLNGYPSGYARLQGDATVNLHHTFFNDFKTSLLLGNTVWQQRYKAMATSSNSLLVPNVYNVAYIGGIPAANESEAKIRQIAFFADLNIGYKNYAFFEGTLRNDRDSRLSAKNRSFYYPSAKLSFVPTDALSFMKDNRVLNYLKIYGSVSRVGNISIGPYQINNIYGVTSGFPYGALGGLSAGTTYYSQDLKPEQVNEIETGLEAALFNNRLSLSATYYKQNSKNQTLTVQTSSATGYNASLLNVGEVQSSGYEFEATADLMTKSANIFGWRVKGNFSINDSKVISLIPGVNTFDILTFGTAAVSAKVGQPFPLLRGTDLNRDPQGRVIVDANTGLPSTNSTPKDFGRTTPKYILGLTSSWTYKIATLTAVSEYRSGYVIYNQVGSTMNFGGSSYVSASAGRSRFIFPNSVINTGTAANPVYTPNTSVSIQDGNYGFWQSSPYNTANSPLVSSAAFWKLREVSLAFDLTQYIRHTGFIKGLNFALTGRNLALWKPKNNPWTDPEFSDTIGNGAGTTSAAQTPATRIYGADLRVTF